MNIKQKQRVQPVPWLPAKGSQGRRPLACRHRHQRGGTRFSRSGFGIVAERDQVLLAHDLSGTALFLFLLYIFLFNI